MVLPLARASAKVLRVPDRLSRVAWLSLSLCHLLLAFAPLTALAMLYALYWRGMALIGDWPSAGLDAPHFIGQTDGLYAFIKGIFDLAFLVGCLGFPLFLVLTAVLSHKRTSLWPFILFLVYAAGWVPFILDLGGRWNWWVD